MVHPSNNDAAQAALGLLPLQSQLDLPGICSFAAAGF